MAFFQADVERAKQQAQEEKEAAAKRSSMTSSSPTIWMKIEPGRQHTVRILPPWTDKGPNAGLPYKRIFQHTDLGPDKKKANCPKAQGEGDCYICEQIESLKATGLPEDKEEASALWPKKQYIYQLIDREDPTWTGREDQIKDKDAAAFIGKPKIKIMSLSQTVHEMMRNYLSNPEYGGAICDPYNGLDCFIERTYTGATTKYGKSTKWGITFARRETPLFGSISDPNEKLINACAEAMVNLDEQFFFKTHTYEETKAIYHGENPWAKDKADKDTQQDKPRASLEAPRNFDSWREMALNGKILSRAEIAAKHAVKEEQIASCYTKEPDHTDNGCWSCPLKADCAKTYHAATGFFTTKPESKPLSRGTWGDDPLAAMEAELSGSKSSHAKPPAIDDMDDIPF